MGEPNGAGGEAAAAVLAAPAQEVVVEDVQLPGSSSCSRTEPSCGMTCFSMTIS